MNLIPFNFNGSDIRVITDDQGEPWFVAADVSIVLEYSEAKDMTRNLDDDEKGRQIVPTLGGDQEMLVISESGLYTAVLLCRKPQAKPFKRWVTGDVLPMIRKTGSYDATPPAELSRLELLEIALASEREKLRVTAERDHAVATKAEIGSRREATALATASAAVRDRNRLRHELGFSARHATVMKVEGALDQQFSYVGLRRWCKANGVTPETVPDKRYADGVKAWPAAAWEAIYEIDLADLFGAEGELA